MLRSIGFISCCFEEVVALFFLEEVADVAEGFPELIVGPGCGFSDQGLEFGECHLERVEIGGVWRQEQEPRADVLLNRPGFAGDLQPDLRMRAPEKSKTSNRYSPEMRARAVCMLLEHQSSYEMQSAAVAAIAPKIGCIPETLKIWVRQAERDSGARWCDQC